MTPQDLRIGVLVYDQFQELEFWYPVLRFRESGSTVTVVGAAGEQTYTSRLGYPVIPDKGIDEVSSADFDAFVVPGGDGAERIAVKPGVVEYIADAATCGTLVGAASQAVKVLAAAGLLKGRRVAGTAEVREAVAAAGGEYTDDAVVEDDGIVTARSPDDLPAFFRALHAALTSPAEAGLTGESR